MSRKIQGLQCQPLPPSPPSNYSYQGNLRLDKTWSESAGTAASSAWSLWPSLFGSGSSRPACRMILCLPWQALFALRRLSSCSPPAVSGTPWPSLWHPGTTQQGHCYTAETFISDHIYLFAGSYLSCMDQKQSWGKSVDLQFADICKLKNYVQCKGPNWYWKHTHMQTHTHTRHGLQMSECKQSLTVFLTKSHKQGSFPDYKSDEIKWIWGLSNQQVVTVYTKFYHNQLNIVRY